MRAFYPTDSFYERVLFVHVYERYYILYNLITTIYNFRKSINIEKRLRGSRALYIKERARRI